MAKQRDPFRFAQSPFQGCEPICAAIVVVHASDSSGSRDEHKVGSAVFWSPATGAANNRIVKITVEIDTSPEIGWFQDRE
jgi:hypothetical protein